MYALARNIAGLLEPDPARAVELLREAVAEFERLEMGVFAVRAMVDLGRAIERAGTASVAAATVSSGTALTAATALDQ